MNNQEEKRLEIKIGKTLYKVALKNAENATITADELVKKMIEKSVLEEDFLSVPIDTFPRAKTSGLQEVFLKRRDMR